MYFNQRVIATVALLSSTTFAGNCSQSVVNQASDNKFLEFVLTNCAPSAVFGAGRNITGGTLLTAQTCLSTFIGRGLNPGPNPIDINSKCGDEFYNFARSITQMTTQNIDLVTTAGHEGCKYSDGKLTMSYVCWNRISTALDSFMDDSGAGYPIYTNPCTVATVRNGSVADFFGNTVKTVSKAVAADVQAVDFLANANPTEKTLHVVPAGFALDSNKLFKATASVKDGMCYGCYAGFLDTLQGGLPWYTTALTDDVKGVCASDPSDPVCLNSLVVAKAVRKFQTCTGFDIAFRGPLCDETANKYFQTNFVAPTPFQYVVKCGILKSDFANECTPDVVDDFSKKVQAAVGIQCGSCFEELKANITALKDNTDVKLACTKDTISSASCQASLASALKAFKDCTGSDLLVDAPAADSSSSSADSGASSTDSSSSTGSGATTTSNASVASSLVGLVAVVMLSSML